MSKFLKQLSIFLGLFLIVVSIIGSSLYRCRDVSEYFPFLRWKEFYVQPKESLDVLFLGSSYSYRSFVPAVFDSILQISSFNLGSSNQTPMTSNLVLKEALRYQKPKLVVMEVCDNTLSVSDNFKSGIHNIDFINSWDIKLELMYSHFNLSQMVEFLMPIYRFNNYKSWLFRKEKKKVRHVADENLFSKYMDAGYVATYPRSTFTRKTLNSKYSAKVNWNSDQIESLNKTISLCNSENITVILVVHPINPDAFDRMSNYHVVEKKLQFIASKRNLKIRNYNTELNFLTPDDFYDVNHLLHVGAKKLSIELATWIKEEKVL